MTNRQGLSYDGERHMDRKRRFWHQFLVSSLEMHVVGLQASDVVVAEREFYYLR